MTGQGGSKTVTLGLNKSVTGLEQVITGPVVWSKDFTGLEQDGCRAGARRLQGWNKMVAGLEQDGCRAGARWLHAGLEHDGCRAGTK